MPLPNEFPKEAARILLGLVTGQPLPETAVLVTAGYDLLGYGLYVGFGNPLVGEDEETAQLKAQLSDPDTIVKMKAALPPAVLSLFLFFIQKLIERLGK